MMMDIPQCHYVHHLHGVHHVHYVQALHQFLRPEAFLKRFPHYPHIVQEARQLA